MKNQGEHFGRNPAGIEKDRQANMHLLQTWEDNLRTITRKHAKGEADDDHLAEFMNKYKIAVPEIRRRIDELDTEARTTFIGQSTGRRKAS